MSHAARRRRRWLLVLLVLAGAAALWAYACQRLQHDLFAGMQDNGWALQAGRVTWAGFPVRAAIDLSDAEAVAGGVGWRAERARAAIAVTSPLQLDVDAGGAQALRIAGLPAIPFTAAGLHIVADLRGTAPARLTVAELRATLPAGPAQLDRGEAAFTPERLDAQLAGLGLPGLGPTIDRLDVSASFRPALPPPGLPNAAARWRDAGGRVAIAGTVEAGPLAAQFRLDVGLDAGLQPEATGTLRARGLPEWFDRLGQAGALNPQAVTAAKAVVAILAAPTGAGPVTIPVTVRQGLIAVAGMPVARLLKLAW